VYLMFLMLLQRKWFHFLNHKVKWVCVNCTTAVPHVHSTLWSHNLSLKVILIYYLRVNQIVFSLLVLVLLYKDNCGRRKGKIVYFQNITCFKHLPDWYVFHSSPLPRNPRVVIYEPVWQRENVVFVKTC